MATIQDRIRLRLTELGLSRTAASLKAGLGQTAVRDILNRDGHSPKAETIEKLAKALEVSPEWLLTGHGDPTEITADIIQLWERIPSKHRPSARQMLEGLAEPVAPKFTGENE